MSRCERGSYGFLEGDGRRAANTRNSQGEIPMAIWWNEARGKYEYDWEDAAKVRHRGYARTKGEAERLRSLKMVEASKATELLGDPN